MNASENQIVVYQPNETVRLDVRLENETVWLTQAQLCELFQRDVSVISRHIKNIFVEGELEKESNLHFLQIANSDRPVALYSLDVIISVGYRVKSVIGTRFRQWANKVLKEYILHGYAINDRIERLEQKVLKHDEQINLVLQTAFPPIQGVFYNEQLWDARAQVPDVGEFSCTAFAVEPIDDFAADVGASDFCGTPQVPKWLISLGFLCLRMMPGNMV